MSLGVLNNLSAMSAANNLNNTQNSLSNVLQQLSSGSKINSGADDAAGLSLVNGLQANSVALAQSQTNAAEGVGLLKVADGALSQVTNLLNRAVTLATEASNGTLNSSQDMAANQEYQSILSEISNIGATTTYNGTAVFGRTVNIYTGDSSMTGASIDSLNIGSLSSSNVGDSGGVMSYSNGANNVFINLSSSATNAKATDYLGGGASGTTSIDVNYLVKGASGTSTSASAKITVGGDSGFANTASGMISAINNSGLGLNATFTTQAEAGVQGGGTQTGIEIAGGQVSTGAAASTVSTSGILNPAGIPNSELLTIGQTFTFSQGGTQAGNTVTIDSSNNTLATLATAIGTETGGKVTATVITNGDGTQSLAVGNSDATKGALTVTTTAPPVPPPALGIASSAFTAPVLNSTSGGVGANAGTTATPGSATFAVAGTNAGATILTEGGSISVKSTLGGNNVTDTFIVGGAGLSDTANTFYTANHGDASNSMANLAATIQAAANLNVTATATAAGLTVTSTTSATGDDVTVLAGSTLTNASNKLGIYSPADGGAATVGAPTYTELNAGGTASQNDQLSGTITFSANLGQNTLLFRAGTDGNTYADLVTFINDNQATLGVTAQWSTSMGGAGGIGGTDHGILLTSLTNDGSNPIVSTGSTLGDATTQAGSSTVTALYGGAGAAESDVIAGRFTFSGIGTDGASHPMDFNHIAADGKTWADLANDINSANVGVTATWNNNSLLLTSNIPGVKNPVVATNNTLADQTNGAGATAGISNFSTAAAANGDFLNGTGTFHANGQTFVFEGDGTSTTFDDLATALSQSNLNVQATFTGGELQVTSRETGVASTITLDPGLVNTSRADAAVAYTTGTAGADPTPVSVTVDAAANGGHAGTNGTPMTIDVVGGGGSSSAGTAGAGPSYATAVLQLDQQSATNPHNIGAGDTITGKITITNGGVSHTFVQGNGVDDANTKYTDGTTIADLTAAINSDIVLGLSATAPGGGTGAIYLQASTPGLDTISSSASTLADVSYAAVTTGTIGSTVAGRSFVAANAASLTVGMAAGAMSGAPDPSLTVNSNDVLKAGSAITVGFGANSRIFTVGDADSSQAATTTYVGTTAGGATLSQLAAAITGYAALGVTATAGTTGLQLASTGTPTGPNQMITASAISLTDNTLGTYSNVSLSGFGSESDTVSGTLNYQVGVTNKSINLTAGETVSAMIDELNDPANNSGVTASWDSGTNSVILTSKTEGSVGNLTPLGTTSVTDTTNTATLTYTASNAYSVGISGDSIDKVYDSTAGQTSSAVAGFVSNQKSASGIATISYSDGAGQSLSATNLLNQTEAQATLNALNAAITAVAAQDGYIGAQINTLNSVSSVLATQQQNVVAAQNAVQATDYATAASNMSKYQILSQTGISALAQANSMQREVTKLLQ